MSIVYHLSLSVFKVDGTWLVAVLHNFRIEECEKDISERKVDVYVQKKLVDYNLGKPVLNQASIVHF